MKQLKQQSLILTLFILCTLLSEKLIAQTSIQGKVTDNKGLPLIGVNIAVKGSYDGATSNINGDFNFETFATDSAIIQATYTGFVTQEKKVFISGKSVQVNITLKEKVNDLKAVVITAGSFEASDEKKGTILKALDIVTTAGSNGDTYGALKTLPGTQQTNDREGLFVRGGTGAETQTFIDGTWVKNAFTASIPDLGSRGRFNPFIFKGTVFSAGGYSALYGQALSSAVILETIDLPERSSANLNLSTVGLGGNLQTLNKSKTESMGIGYNYVNLTPYFALIKQNIKYKQAPTVHQFDMNFRKKTSESGMFKFYGYFNSTGIDIQRKNVNSQDYYDISKSYQDGFKIKNKNGYVNFSYKNYYAHDWKLNAGLSASVNDDQIDTKILDQQGQLVTDSNFINQNWIAIKGWNQAVTGKVVLEKNLQNLNAIRFGLEYINSLDKSKVAPGQYQDSIVYSDVKISDNYVAAFAESDIYLTNEIAGKVGVRAEYSSLLNQMNIAPRVSAAYKINRGGQLSFAYGMFYQKPEQQYLLRTKDLDFMRADHYILNYQYQPKDRLLRLEAYYKNYHGLIKTNSATPTGISNLGKGYARGFELFYRDKKTIKGIDFWISYSFIDTKRDFLNYLRQTQPDFVANHMGSLVFKKFWPKYMFGINGTYTYTTGRPYINYNITHPDNKYADPNQFMTDKTIDYHNISLSINYLKNIGKAFTVFVLSVNNPFGFKQVYGNNFARYDLNMDQRYYQQAITPPARQFIFLGMFMSFGIDRSQEAIDNNL